MMDFQIKRSTRRCHATGKDLKPGDEFFSELVTTSAGEAMEFVRHDYCIEAWGAKRPAPDAVGWWRGRIPTLDSNRVYWAPAEVLKEYFYRLLASPQCEARAWVMAMLLVRKRLLRLEQEETDAAGQARLVVHDVATGEDHRLPVVELTAEDQATIQREFAEHLFTDQPGG